MYASSESAGLVVVAAAAAGAELVQGVQPDTVEPDGLNNKSLDQKEG